MQLDHRIYDEWGQRIAAGEWVGGEAYFVDPLYAYFLGTTYWIVGHRPVVVLVIQALIGVGTCYLVSLLGRRCVGPRLATNRPTCR
jgi:4-amino-4-deoxy-L-arabinose transferase-like glycosyltransferase